MHGIKRMYPISKKASAQEKFESLNWTSPNIYISYIAIW